MLKNDQDNQFKNNRDNTRSIIPLIIGIIIVILVCIYSMNYDAITNFLSHKEDSENVSVETPIHVDTEIEEPTPPQIDDHIEPTDDETLTTSDTTPIRTTPLPDIKKEPIEDSPKASPQLPTKKKYKLTVFRNSDYKYGFKEVSSDNVIIEPQYDGYVHTDELLRGTEFIAVYKNKKYGIIDVNNSTIIPFDFDDLSWAYSARGTSYWLGRKGQLYGLIRGSDATTTLPTEYQEIKIIGSSFFAVKKDGLYGCVDNHNKVIVPIQYRSIRSWTDQIRITDPSKMRVSFSDGNNNLFTFDGKGNPISE